MKLYQSPTSPFVRIALAAAMELDLSDRIELVAARAPGANLGDINPLDKIPTLITDDGETLIESRLICQYLDSLGGPRLYPADPAARRAVLQMEAVVQGVMDAVVLRRQETRREATEQSQWWIDRQMRKIELGLAMIEDRLDGFTGNDTIVPIEVCCCLEFMDRLAPEIPGFDWRANQPRLAAWHLSYRHTPSIVATRPDAG